MNDRRFYTARVHRHDGTPELLQVPFADDGSPSEYIDYNQEGVVRRYVLAPERVEFDIAEYHLEQPSA